MKADDAPLEGAKNDPMMPVAWTKSYTGKSGKASRIFTTTMERRPISRNTGVRRMLVNATYWALGMEDQITDSPQHRPRGRVQADEVRFRRLRQGSETGRPPVAAPRRNGTPGMTHNQSLSPGRLPTTVALFPVEVIGWPVPRPMQAGGDQGHLMRTLVLWDDAEQIDLLQMYLNVDEGVVSTTLDPEMFLASVRSSRNRGTSSLMTTTHLLDPDHAFRPFHEVGEQRPVTLTRRRLAISEGVPHRPLRRRAAVLRHPRHPGDYLFLPPCHAGGGGPCRSRAERERADLAIAPAGDRTRSASSRNRSSRSRSTVLEGYQITARYESSQIRVFVAGSR